jgi:DNA-binding MurR/RpiR family transcriptional regulator
VSLKDIVESFDGKLTDSDRRLIGVLLADPVECSYLAAQEVAQRAGVHESTAGRLALKLGFKNYRSLRGGLRKTRLAEGETSAGRIRQRLDKVAERSILEVLVESEIRALTEMPAQIDPQQMTKAALALRDAGHVYLFGQGHAASLMDLFDRRLTRSGYRVTTVNHIDWEAADRLAALTAGDVLVTCAFRRPVDRLDRLFKHARSRRAVTILIGDMSGLMMRPRPDISLCASRGTEGESQSLTVPMAICNALVLELSRLDEGRSLAALDDLAALTAQLRGSDEPDKTTEPQRRRATKAPRKRNAIHQRRGR